MKNMENFDNIDNSDLIFKKGHIDETWKSVKIDGLEAFKSSTTKFGKCFWLLMMCIASAILIYELYKSVDNYLNSPTVATYKIKPQSKMDFPDIYLCNTNFVKQSQLTTNNHTKRVAYLYSNLAGSSILNTNEECLIRNLTEADSDSADAQQMYKDFMTLGYNIDELFLACSFRQYVFDPIDCSEIARPVLDPVYGKCFVISVGDRKQILGAQALMLVVYLQKHEYPVDPCLTPDTEGISLSVGKSPLNPVDTQMTYIIPGTYNRVDLTTRHLSFINVNTNRIQQPCVENDTYEFTVFNNRVMNYSQTACQRDCLLKTIIQTCNCLPIMDINYVKTELLNNNISFCNVQQNRDCVLKRVTQSKRAEELISNCSSRCYPFCTVYRYPTRVTSLPLNQAFLPPSFKANDIIYLMISFVNMETEIFEQNPAQTIDDMISNLGGQINLWVGSSMLTLIQLPIVLCMLFGWSVYELVQKYR